jgi:hypothetical protein
MGWQNSCGPVVDAVAQAQTKTAFHTGVALCGGMEGGFAFVHPFGGCFF